jgi:hypothetical protein
MTIGLRGGRFSLLGGILPPHLTSSNQCYAGKVKMVKYRLLMLTTIESPSPWRSHGETTKEVSHARAKVCADDEGFPHL